MEHTYHRLMAEAETALADAGIADARAQSQLLLEYISGFDQAGYLLHASEIVPAQQKEAFDRLLALRCKRIPLQQLTKAAPFDGLTLTVNRDVLIPRLDTECLLEQGKTYLRQLYDRRQSSTFGSKSVPSAPRVLDLCTGSGCIALAIKKAFPSVECVASDCSDGALAIARENARRCHLDVFFVRGDLWEPFSGNEDRFDLILSNPPYIPTDVIASLEPEVRDHEPRLALDGGADGLLFYRRIAARSSDFLKKGGALMLEIGYDQGITVPRILRENGFTEIEVLQDLAGRDRVVTACI